MFLSDAEIDLSRRARNLSFERYFESKYLNMKQRIRRKGLPYMALSSWKRYLKQTIPDRFELWIRWREEGWPRSLAPSIDRINPLKGYVPSNVRWITHSHNAMLGRRNETSCKKGHPWIEENIIHRPDGSRKCTWLRANQFERACIQPPEGK